MNRSTRRIAAIILVIVVIALVAARDRFGEGDDVDTPPGDLQAASVVRVVDGDTIVVSIDGQEERVRYIGIDTPETVKPESPQECFGKQASDENRRLVEGRIVYLERDVSETDAFDRLLRYVYVDGAQGAPKELVNLELVRGGYAQSVAYPPDTHHQAELDAAEREARANRVGMWSACPTGISR